MNKIELLIQQHKNIPFPGFPDNEDFANWVENLIEVDGYYVGLATSIAHGGKQLIDKSLFIKLKNQMDQYASVKGDKIIFDKYIEYTDSLNQLIELSAVF